MPREDDNIRPEDLIRATQKEARQNKGALKNIPVTPANYKKFEGGRGKLPKGLWWATGGLAVLFIAGFAISYFVFKGTIVGTVASQEDTFAKGVQDLQNLDPQGAHQKFLSLTGSSSLSLPGIFNLFSSIFQGGKGTVGSLGDVANQLATFSQNLSVLEDNFFNLLTTGQGGNLTSTIATIRTTLVKIDEDSAALSSAAQSFGGLPPLIAESYLPLKAQIQGTEKFLDAFSAWLSDGAVHHILITLNNTSEMRPGGGFVGSYADVSIQNGNILGVDVRDVADVDLAFNPNIVPPKPLQPEVSRFRPADANWFFDFPTSASETIQLFESSTLYAASSTKFDGMIAVTPAVVSDLLAETGSITIPAPTTTFTADNVVIQIQKIVQAGQAQNATYPKKVLSALSSAIFTKIASSTAEEKRHLLTAMLGWVTKRDVEVYFKDPDFENFAIQYGSTGNVYELPSNFNGDYLAVVNANIRGDKTDLYVKQNIDFESSLNRDGSATNHLTITRTHTGDKSPYWWYQTTSQDYLQLFVTPGSSLDNESGGIVKTINAPVNYASKKYLVDPFIFAIETSTRQSFAYPAVAIHDEGGKTVFATWAIVPKGTATTLSFDFSHRLFAPPVEGQKYQLIFEKQPGAGGHYKFDVNAPLGYKFAENGLASFEYETDDPDGTTIINLTLTAL